MVVGNGMIAKEFKSYKDNDEVIVFASGVSDSTNTDTSAFERELNLIADTIDKNRDKLFAYFSTCSVYDSTMLQSDYVQHKLSMENFVKKHHPQFIIFRISNPIGYTNNTHTVVNYFINNIRDKQPFEVWKNASRNIIDLDDMFLICNDILKRKLFLNTTVNIANLYNYSVGYIISCIETHFKITGNYHLVNKGGSPIIEAHLNSLLANLNIQFDKDYFPKLLQKYFPA